MSSNSIRAGLDRAMQLVRSGRTADAQLLLTQLRHENPGDLALAHAAASLLQASGRFREAVSLYQGMLAEHSCDTEVLCGLARAQMLMRDIAAAVQALDQALRIDPTLADFGGMIEAVLDEIDDPESIRELFEGLCARNPDVPSIFFRLSKQLSRTDRLDEAEAAIRRYQSLFSEDPAGWVEEGVIASYRGESDKATKCFDHAVELCPDHGPAWWEITLSDPSRLDGERVARMQALASEVAEESGMSDYDDILARHFQRIGDHEAAAKHSGRANRIRVRTTPLHRRYDPQRRESEIDAVIGSLGSQTLDRLRGAGAPDERPVFVMGMPRSGTTLAERMLSAHPDVGGIGEQRLASESFRRALIGSLEQGSDDILPNAVRTAAEWHLREMDDRMRRLGVPPDCKRVVDKLPDNYVFAGWIATAFPNSLIIHCIRDPRDVALSCWQMRFTGLQWSLDLEHIAHQIEQHRRLMRHWRPLLGRRLLELRYERLATNPEQEMRRLLAAAGLDWEPDVLDFAERNGIVRSASRRQVREPLHARSIGRWRNYENALQPILARLEAIVEQDAREATPDTAWPTAG